PVEQEEPCQTEARDQCQLFLEALMSASFVAVRAAVAVLERTLADSPELHVGGLLGVGEVRVAVAELLRQVEAEPVGELDCAGDGISVVGKPLDRLLRSQENRLVVAAPLALA